MGAELSGASGAPQLVVRAGHATGVIDSGDSEGALKTPERLFEGGGRRLHWLSLEGGDGGG